MIELKTNLNEKAIIVALKTNSISREELQEHLAEMKELARTAGATVVKNLVQEKDRPDSAFFIGKGKSEELLQLAELHDVNLIIFDDDLSPVQVRNLEKLLNRKIVDRSGLILDIFSAHAKTKEAKTQVELAQYEYLLPRLTRAWTHLSKQFGGIGTKGPGETQIETDRRIIRRRITHLKNILTKIERQRETQSQKRNDVVRAAIVGYTNAGKSTLFNLLTNAEALAENKLFATLDSTTRVFSIAKEKKILLSDTVGFIRKLPHNLVASFKSTLKEVRDADIIIQVVDVTHPFYEDHVSVVEETLKELGCGDKINVRVFNKVDILENKELIPLVSNRYENSVVLSAERGINIAALVEKIGKILDEDYVNGSIVLPLFETKKLSQIHSMAKVISTKYDDENITITYKTKKENSEKIKRLIHD